MPGRDVFLQMPSGVHHHLLPCADGGTVHAVEMGVGRSIVLIHGLSLSAGIWAPQLRSLSHSLRVVALDVRGHGRSRPGSAGLSISSVAQDLGVVLEGLDLRDCVVVGHSMGGMAALSALGLKSTTASRISGLVLLNSAGGPLNRAPGLLPMYGTLAGSSNRFTLGTSFASLPLASRAWYLASASFGRHAPADQKRLTWDMAVSTSPSTVVGFLRDILNFDISKNLKDIDVPVVIVSGTRDLVLPPYHSKRLFQSLSNRQHWSVSGAGHMLMLERQAAVHQAVVACQHERLKNGIERFVL